MEKVSLTLINSTYTNKDGNKVFISTMYNSVAPKPPMKEVTFRCGMSVKSAHSFELSGNTLYIRGDKQVEYPFKAFEISRQINTPSELQKKLTILMHEVKECTEFEFDTRIIDVDLDKYMPKDEALVFAVIEDGDNIYFTNVYTPQSITGNSQVFYNKTSYIRSMSNPAAEIGDNVIRIYVNGTENELNSVWCGIPKSHNELMLGCFSQYSKESGFPLAIHKIELTGEISKGTNANKFILQRILKVRG